MLSKKQLDEVRAAYAPIERVNPDRLPQMRAMLSKLSPKDLKAISTANIKFISAIAKNMVNEQKRA